MKTIEDQIRIYARHADENLPWVDPIDVMATSAIRTVPSPTAPIRERPKLWVAVAAAAAVLVVVGGVALVASGTSSEDPSGTTEPSTVPTTVVSDVGAWEPLGPTVSDFLPYPPHAVVLSDGRIVKIAEGWGDPNPIEVLDPVTGVVEVAGSTLVSRGSPVVVALGDDRVLILGGDTVWTEAFDSEGSRSVFGAPSDVTTAEVFDPVTGLSVSAGPLMVPRYYPTALLLRDGRVLVTGGSPVPDENGLFTGDDTNRQSAELYDPATNGFTATGSRNDSEHPLGGLVLPDGRGVLFGSTVEIYDPSTGSFVRAGTRIDAASSLGVGVVLSDGNALLFPSPCSEDNRIGSSLVSEGYLERQTEVLDPTTGVLSPGPILLHCVGTATQLPDGTVFVTGFWYESDGLTYNRNGGLASSERPWAGVLDPATGAVELAAPPHRHSPAAFLLLDGEVMLVGGVPIPQGDSLPWAEIYR